MKKKTKKQQNIEKQQKQQELEKEQEQRNQLEQKGKQYLPSNKTYAKGSRWRTSLLLLPEQRRRLLVSNYLENRKNYRKHIFGIR